MTIDVKILKYSVGPTQYHKPLLTIEARYPRFIHAELMTHRVFSRNAASSRAIPTSKLIQEVMDDPAIPVYWGKNQPGMQAAEECDNPISIENFGTNASDPSLYEGMEIWSRYKENVDSVTAWLHGRDQMVELAQKFNDAGYHKQIVNRILEPWMHIRVVITSVSWANFFALRDHPAAQPEIQELARQIKSLKDASEPEVLEYNQWHIPYDEPDLPIQDRIKISVARCASTSYKTVDGKDMTIERALELNDKLLNSNPLHASPAEHQASPDYYNSTYDPWSSHNVSGWVSPSYHGNLTGYIQYRKTLKNEYVGD